MDNENVSELPNRPELIARLADNVIPPDTISTVPNTVTEIPLGRFTNNIDLPTTEGAGEVGPIGNNGGGTGSSVGTEQPATEVVKLPDPPPVPRAERKKPVTQSKGEVVSAKAIDGHPFFKLDAERAAKRAKFRPTYLGDQPVRVTGVIVYRFSR
jgi:hypothetical protein